VTKESEPCQLIFSGFLKVAFQGSRVTSDAGLILVCEWDKRVELDAIIAEHLSDSGRGLNPQFPLRDLLRQSIHSRLAGYEDLNDAARLSTDPTFRLIGSLKRWDRSAALTSTLHEFGTERLISLLATLVLAAIPALESTRSTLSLARRGVGRTATTSPGGRRSRNVLVVAQVATALVPPQRHLDGLTTRTRTERLMR